MEIKIEKRGKQVTLVGEDQTVLATAEPSFKMSKDHNGKRYQPWVLKVSEPGYKYGFVVLPSRKRAIEVMKNNEELAIYRGRKRND